MEPVLLPALTSLRAATSSSPLQKVAFSVVERIP